MNVFNSLGSNYNFGFALRALFANDFGKAEVKLTTFLSQKYDGKAVLTYKGREAIKLAIEAINLPIGSAVAINGFTCYAVYEAIVKAGATPHYVDIKEGQMNFAAAALSQSLRANQNIRAVIIQNTLGFPCDGQGIKQICTRNNLILIEDLAHSVGSRYQSGVEAGTIGDFTVLSFGQDKIIDAVGGGALITKNKRFFNHPPALACLPQRRQLRDMFYPLLTWLIRRTYTIGLGKALHVLFKKTRMLSQPMGPALSQVHRLSNWYCSNVEQRFEELESNISHRRQIAHIYKQLLNPEIILPRVVRDIDLSTNLRFPIVVEGRGELIIFLNHRGIHISDIWYDAPVAPAKYLFLTDYDGQCPEAENLAATILNLPTHQGISEGKARQIAEAINQWLSQNKI